jgi:hypothetical protein
MVRNGHRPERTAQTGIGDVEVKQPRVRDRRPTDQRPDGIRWERHVEHSPRGPQQYRDVATFDGRMWVLEGYSGTNRNEVLNSEDGSNRHELPGTPWSRRHASRVNVFDKAPWVVAGNNMEPDAWKLVRRREPDRASPGPGGPRGQRLR